MRRTFLLLRVLLAVLALGAPLALGACGDDAAGGSGSEAGTVVTGPGVQTGKPPWKVEEQHLAQRVRMVGAPPPGKEIFHQHALLHVYVDGILQPIPRDLAYQPKRGITSGLHTHEPNGVIHLEAEKPFTATLGDFFLQWGLRLSKTQLGGLTDDGDRQVRAYSNGKPIADPAAHVIKKDDNLVVAYGKEGTFPLKPFTGPLKDANSGKSTCGTKNGKSVGNCMVEPS